MTEIWDLLKKLHKCGLSNEEYSELGTNVVKVLFNILRNIFPGKIGTIIITYIISPVLLVILFTLIGGVLVLSAISYVIENISKKINLKGDTTNETK